MSERLTISEMRNIADTRRPYYYTDHALERVVKIDNNTYRATYYSPVSDKRFDCVFHQRTPILFTDTFGALHVTTGGWNTTTTRDRLNKFLPSGYRVCTIKGGMWLVHAPQWNWANAQWHRGEDFTIEPNGNVWGGEAWAVGGAPLKRNLVPTRPSVLHANA